MCVTLITTPCWNLQIVVYLKLMEMCGRENDGGVFLWLVTNIKISVTAPHVIEKCRTDVLASVLWNVRDSMEFQCI